MLPATRIPAMTTPRAEGILVGEPVLMSPPMTTTTTTTRGTAPVPKAERATRLRAGSRQLPSGVKRSARMAIRARIDGIALRQGAEEATRR